jgi:hypothetical protein
LSGDSSRLGGQAKSGNCLTNFEAGLISQEAYFIQENINVLSELVSAVQKPSPQRLLSVSSVVIWVVKLSTSPQDECFKKA